MKTYVTHQSTTSDGSDTTILGVGDKLYLISVLADPAVDALIRIGNNPDIIVPRGTAFTISGSDTPEWFDIPVEIAIVLGVAPGATSQGFIAFGRAGGETTASQMLAAIQTMCQTLWQLLRGQP